jgi:peptidoglycan/xylan/chitin deacetylase (PgdA/CDA1 family)
MRQPRVLSLLWHSVEPASIHPEFLDGSNPSEPFFRKQLDFLVSNYTPISIGEFHQIRNTPRRSLDFTKPPVLFTFDDGLKNVILRALPILEEYRVPATLFLLGELFRNSEFVPWFIERKHFLRKTTKRRVSYQGIDVDLTAAGGRRRIRDLHKANYCGCRDEEERQKLMTGLSELLEVKRPLGSELDEDLQLVTPQDLSGLGRHPLLSVASHAMTHCPLTSLKREEQAYELSESDSVLRQYCPGYFPAISYPGGYLNTVTLRLAREIYRLGFGVLLGTSYADAMAYPRVSVSQNNVSELKYAVSPIRLHLKLPLKRLILRTGVWNVE